MILDYDKADEMVRARLVPVSVLDFRTKRNLSVVLSPSFQKQHTKHTKYAPNAFYARQIKNTRRLYYDKVAQAEFESKKARVRDVVFALWEIYGARRYIARQMLKAGMVKNIQAGCEYFANGAFSMADRNELIIKIAREKWGIK